MHLSLFWKFSRLKTVLGFAFALFCIGVFAPLAHATTYYVSNSGSDSNNGTSTSTPWQTIAHVNAQSFSPGDSILFQCGGTWREQLTVPSSGSSGNPIVFDRYGTCTGSNNPVIDGSVVVNSWTATSTSSDNALSDDMGGSGWFTNYATVTANTAPDPRGTANQFATFTDTTDNSIHQEYYQPSGGTAGTTYVFSVFVKPVSNISWASLTLTYSTLGWSNLGQATTWFNLYGNGSAPYTYTSGVASGTFAGITPAGNGYYRVWVGMQAPSGTVNTEVYLQSSQTDGQWSYVGNGGGVFDVGWADYEAASAVGNYNPYGSYTVYSASGITQPTQVFENGNRYLPVSSESQMNAGTFWWNSSSSMLYVRTSGDNAPSNYTITASQSDYNVSIVNHSYLTFQHLVLNAAAWLGLLIQESVSGVNFASSTVSNAFAHGIQSFTLTNNIRTGLNITGDTITGSGGDGINFQQYTQSSTIQDNTVTDNSQLWSGISSYPYNEIQAWTSGIKFIGIGTTASVIGNLVTNNVISSNGPSNTGLWSTYPLNINTLNMGLGIWFDTVQATSTHPNVVNFNQIMSNENVGLQFEVNAWSVAANNIVAFNGNNDGITVVGDVTSTASQNNSVFGNTIYGNVGAGIGFVGNGTAGTCMNNTATNNISVANTAEQLLALQGCENDGTNGSGNVYTYNNFGSQASNFIWWGGTYDSPTYESDYSSWETASGNCGSVGCSHSKESDPLFISTSTNNFALSSSSPTIDAGLNLGSSYEWGLDPASTWPSNIILDNQNSYGSGWDIGAYVYTQTSTPSVAMTAPTASSTVSGTISVTATSSAVAPASIASVQFYFDGSPLGSAVTSSPYTISWNTASVSNASHTLYALSTDNYSNTATSSNISITVYNAPPPPMPPAGVPQSAFTFLQASTAGVASSTASTTSTTSTASSSPSLSSTASSSLQTELNILLAELQRLETQAGASASSNASSSYIFTTNLQLYDTGADVHALQLYLISKDTGPAAEKLKVHGITQTFGTLTYNALIEFQKNVGITPASGFFGPITRAWVNGHE
jgi:hypothetical protein